MFTLNVLLGSFPGNILHPNQPFKHIRAPIHPFPPCGVSSRQQPGLCRHGLSHRLQTEKGRPESLPQIIYAYL